MPKQFNFYLIAMLIICGSCFHSSIPLEETSPKQKPTTLYLITNNTGFDFVFKAYYDTSKSRREGTLIDSVFVKKNGFDSLKVSYNRNIYSNFFKTRDRGFGGFERLELKFKDGKTTHYNYRIYGDSLRFIDSATTPAENPLLGEFTLNLNVKDTFNVYPMTFNPISYQRAR